MASSGLMVLAVLYTLAFECARSTDTPASSRQSTTGDSSDGKPLMQSIIAVGFKRIHLINNMGNPFAKEQS